MSLPFLLKNIPFEIERAMCSKANAFLKRRQSSKPFLSGDTYRKIADAIFDETGNCCLEQISDGNIVFVKTDRLEEFNTTIISKINCNIILITHQSDINIDSSFAHIADNPHIKQWFAQNCLLEHPKVTPLPIGLEDQWRHNNGNVADFKKLSKKKYTKKAHIIFGFSLGTNPDKRFLCYKGLWRHPFANEIYQAPNSRLYRKKAAQYMFVASPPGNGLDCHRTWEAMYFKTIPIVENNYMNRYFASLGLPLLCIEDWNEIKKWDESFIKKTYADIMEKSHTDALWLDYWEKKFDV